MIVISSHVNGACDFRTVVAGEDHQRVLRDSQSVQRPHQLADNEVQLNKKVTMGSSLRCPLKLPGRK